MSVRGRIDTNGYVLAEILVSVMIAAISIGALLYGLTKAAQVQKRAEADFTSLLSCEEGIENYLANFGNVSVQQANLKTSNTGLDVTIDGVAVRLPATIRGVRLNRVECSLDRGTKLSSYILLPGAN